MLISSKSLLKGPFLLPSLSILKSVPGLILTWPNCSSMKTDFLQLSSLFWTGWSLNSTCFHLDFYLYVKQKTNWAGWYLEYRIAFNFVNIQIWRIWMQSESEFRTVVRCLVLTMFVITIFFVFCNDWENISNKISNCPWKKRLFLGSWNATLQWWVEQLNLNYIM